MNSSQPTVLASRPPTHSLGKSSGVRQSMARILALSSWVAHGHVGLSAAAPVLQILGHTVTQLPTVQLSNHPGFPHVGGSTTEPEMLRAMVTALDENGWIDTVDAILTGYLPSPAHVDVAVDLIDRFQVRQPRVIVDPILGDDPGGLYIAQDAAEALRDRLLPRADVLTPNAFELSWLTGRATPTLDAAVEAARDLKTRTPAADVLVTSAPIESEQTGVLAVGPSGTRLFLAPRAAEDRSVPRGVGDVFSALIAGGLPTGHALGLLHALIDESLDAPHLAIAEAAADWTKAEPIPATVYAPLTSSGEAR